ncbi:RNA-directed DNA polymerase from mobile element jockey [Eumeta japonica]|uniref:RNA-directed DNA polymerase from mobile element jockey n=1 Tax=Eumeta variegata TaxID=151549 RepID=A0A4C1VNF2_EUMVA|nr:RNA-directed DNA polymerase from mobile element jockey [Eumeta japonica]
MIIAQLALPKPAAELIELATSTYCEFLQRISDVERDRTFKRGPTNLTEDLGEGGPSTATTGDNFGAVLLMIETDKKMTYQQIQTSLGIVVQLALFADNATLFLHSASFNHIIPRLQRAIDELTQWFQLWRIEVNSEKPAAIYFDYSNIKRTLAVPYNAPIFRLSNAPIPWQHNYKYLGITLDKHLHFRDHIQRVREVAIFYMSRLNGMIDGKSKMSLRNKRTLYTVCIRPTMTCACPVFAHAAPTALQDLQVIEINFCRRATGAQWYVKNFVIHRDLELPTLSKYMKEPSERFFSIAINHPNSLISVAASYEAPPANHFLRPLNALLNLPDDLTAEVEELNKALDKLECSGRRSNPEEGKQPTEDSEVSVVQQRFIQNHSRRRIPVLHTVVPSDATTN